MTKIITDSACDIKGIRLVYDRNKEPVQFARAPLTIRIGDKEFVDDNTMDVAEMMYSMKEHQGATSSACPAPGDWCREFAGADEIYVVTITSSLSGSYNSAIVAKEMELEEHPEKQIHVIDTLSAGPEMELVVRRLLCEIQSGREFEDICENITTYMKQTKLAFVLHSIDNLVKNGRVSRLAGFAASVLGIIVVGRASKKGELEMIGKCRGNARTNSSVVQEMKLQGYDGGQVSITHCFNEKAAEQLKEKILCEYPGADVTVAATGGLCSYYAEHGGLMIGYEVKEREFSLAGALPKPEDQKEYSEA